MEKQLSMIADILDWFCSRNPKGYNVASKPYQLREIHLLVTRKFYTLTLRIKVHPPPNYSDPRLFRARGYLILTSINYYLIGNKTVGRKESR